jgi:hypothetical protein
LLFAKHMNELYEQKDEFFTVERDDTYNNHWAFEGLNRSWNFVCLLLVASVNRYSVLFVCYLWQVLIGTVFCLSVTCNKC